MCLTALGFETRSAPESQWMEFAHPEPSEAQSCLGLLFFHSAQKTSVPTPGKVPHNGVSGAFCSMDTDSSMGWNNREKTRLPLLDCWGPLPRPLVVKDTRLPRPGPRCGASPRKGCRLNMGLNDKVWPDIDLGRRSNWERGVCYWKVLL